MQYSEQVITKIVSDELTKSYDTVRKAWENTEARLVTALSETPGIAVTGAEFSNLADSNC